MSPLIWIVPSIEPSQCLVFGFDAGGTTSAIGSPNLVTRIGRRVLRTRSRMARQVALNFEIAISSITSHLSFTIVYDHSQPQQATAERKQAVLRIEYAIDSREWLASAGVAAFLTLMLSSRLLWEIHP